jgi:hypothetical protein
VSDLAIDQPLVNSGGGGVADEGMVQDVPCEGELAAAFSPCLRGRDPKPGRL